MTDTTAIEHAAGADERAEALDWLARRVRWDALLDSLRETPGATSASDEVEREDLAA
jgi:hypothetical protein